MQPSTPVTEWRLRPSYPIRRHFPRSAPALRDDRTHTRFAAPSTCAPACRSLPSTAAVDNHIPHHANHHDKVTTLLRSARKSARSASLVTMKSITMPIVTSSAEESKRLTMTNHENKGERWIQTKTALRSAQREKRLRRSSDAPGWTKSPPTKGERRCFTTTCSQALDDAAVGTPRPARHHQTTKCSHVGVVPSNLTPLILLLHPPSHDPATPLSTSTSTPLIGPDKQPQCPDNF